MGLVPTQKPNLKAKMAGKSGTGTIWYRYHLVLVPFGTGTIWHRYHLAPVPFGTGTIWHRYHLVQVPFSTRHNYLKFCFLTSTRTEVAGFGQEGRDVSSLE